MRLADVVAASEAVAGTSSRSRNVAVLADLRRPGPGEVPAVVGFLSGGRAGAGSAGTRGRIW